MVSRTDVKIFPLALESFVAKPGVVFNLADDIGAIRSSDAFGHEMQLNSLLDELSGIKGGIPELTSGGDAPNRVQGTAAC